MQGLLFSCKQSQKMKNVILLLLKISAAIIFNKDDFEKQLYDRKLRVIQK